MAVADWRGNGLCGLADVDAREYARGQKPRADLAPCTQVIAGLKIGVAG